MNKLFLLFLISLSISSFGQRLVIDTQFKCDKTTISYKDYTQKIKVFKYSRNRTISDTTFVYFYNSRLHGTAVRLVITDTVLPNIRLFSDYGQYDGKSNADFGLKNYSLTLNRTEYKKGDTLMGKFECLSLPIKYQNDETIYLYGNIFHVFDD